MKIREMTYSDIHPIRDLAFVTWRDTYSSFIPPEIQDQVLADAYSDKEMNHRLQKTLNLVLESNDAILGYAFFSGDLSNTDIYLESLYIHPEHQGKGIGKQLMQAGIAKYRNPKTISLVVYKGNTSISFYEKMGFSITNENCGDFFGHPVSFIMMKKELES